MTVHVGEIASEVTTVGTSVPVAPERRDTAPGPGVAEEQWEELRRRAAWLADRVRAEGFHD